MMMPGAGVIFIALVVVAFVPAHPLIIIIGVILLLRVVRLMLVKV